MSDAVEDNPGAGGSKRGPDPEPLDDRRPVGKGTGEGEAGGTWPELDEDEADSDEPDKGGSE